MPSLRNIPTESYDFLKFRNLPWFPEAANHSGLAKGGIYLLSGPPSSGKSTLALQMCVDLACQGRKVVYVTLELSPQNLKHWVEDRVFPHRHKTAYTGDARSLSWKEILDAAGQALEVKGEEERVENNFSIDSNVSGMEQLPDFLTRHVLGVNVPYVGTHLIVVDSLQGLGTASTSSKPYQRLFEFNRWAKDHGITALLIGHITKAGAIAGPRSLEHNVDCVLYLRKAMRFRPLFVPKNRFGPERHEPLTLVLDDLGCLEKSKHAKARASRAFGYLPGNPDVIEVQALVKLPKYGERPGLKAPYLPKQKLTQLVGIASGLRDIDISDLNFEINCAIPGGRQYSQTLDLPLIITMLSSYFQAPIPPGSLFVGEVDLFGEVRPMQAEMCQAIAQILDPNQLSPISRLVEKVFVSEQNEADLTRLLAEGASQIKVHGLTTLESLIRDIWPDAVGSEEHAGAAEIVP